METLSNKKLPWWRFWKTEEEKRQDVVDKAYYWAFFQITNGKTLDQIRNWTSAPDDSENLKLVSTGIEKAITDFQEIAETGS